MIASPGDVTGDLWAQSADIREALAYRWDAAAFAEACGFPADPWQQKFLRSKSKRRDLNCSRQVGKSTVVGYGAMHMAIYKPQSLILLLSPGERQSTELMRKCYDVVRAAPHAPVLVHEGVEYMEFTNGSRVLALPGKENTIRGYSAVDLLVIDEASRVPDTLFFAVQPMLAVSGGEMWTLSSPFGTRGFWYNEYKQLMADRKAGRPNEWDYYEVPATMVPRITPEFLAAERRRMGEWWFRQEYMCEFMDAQAAAFTASAIDASFEEEVIPWQLMATPSRGGAAA